MCTLSIITINYNNIEGLKKTIESVLMQTYIDFEWIVIDGGSTDGSKELLEKYDDHFSYWVSEKDSGIYPAMNKAISLIKGKYCQFLNSGDLFSSAYALNEVMKNPLFADVHYANVNIIAGSDIIEKRTYPSKLTIDFLFRSPLGHQATFIRSEIMKNVLYNAVCLNS